MEKEFDFKNIGKRMPYRTPDGFFGKMQKQVLERTQAERFNRQHRIKLIIGATLAIAAVMLGVLFFPISQPVAEELPSPSLIVSTDLDSSYSDTLDRYIESMSDHWKYCSSRDWFYHGIFPVLGGLFQNRTSSV